MNAPPHSERRAREALIALEAEEAGKDDAERAQFLGAFIAVAAGRLADLIGAAGAERTLGNIGGAMARLATAARAEG